MQTMTTSFTVQPVASDEALAMACEVRALSYGHHVPDLRASFAQPDALDESGTCVTFLATEKLTGKPIGTLRIQLGHREQPLLLEASWPMPPELELTTRAELTRMSVLRRADPLVRLLLWKAGFYFCLANQTECMVIGARLPALIRQYKGLGFTDLTHSAVPFAHAGGLPHHVLHFDVRSAERRWFNNHHTLYEFMFTTHHPDLHVMGPRWRPAVAGADQRSVAQVAGRAGTSAEPSQRLSIA
jgi:hypothetical protein